MLSWAPFANTEGNEDELELQRQSAQNCALFPTNAHLCCFVGTEVIYRSATCRENAVPKISVLLTDADARQFEAYCEERGHKKSTLIARLIREHLVREGFPRQGTLLDDAPKRGRTRHRDERKLDDLSHALNKN